MVKPDQQHVEAVLSMQHPNNSGYTTVSSKGLNLGPVTWVFSFIQSPLPFPQVSQEQFEKILDYIKRGEEQGAKLETGGKRVGDKG